MSLNSCGMVRRGLTGWGKRLAFQTLRLARWCNGSTADSGSVCHGSNPCRAAKSFATSDDFVRLRVVDTFVKILVAHHHRRAAATGETFDKFNRELAVSRRLRAVRVSVEAELV